jgi:anti-sigma-K factor RskA
MNPKTRRFAAAVLVLAVAVPVAGGSAATRSSDALPRQLVGTWTRTLTAAGWKKAGASDFSYLVGAYTMVIKANGTTLAVGYAAKFSQLSGGRLRIGSVTDCGSIPSGLYKWKVAKGRLTLTKVRDSCPLEIGLFAGVWKKTKK